MIDPSAIRVGLNVFVGISIEHPARVATEVFDRGGRPYVRVRYNRSRETDDVPLTVVRAMTQQEESMLPKRQQKSWRKRLEEAAKRPPVRSRAVSVRDIAREAGYSDDEIAAAVERMGEAGE